MKTDLVTTKWLGEMAFEATNQGGLIKMDADAEVGGNNDGLRPKSMMLASLAGCSAMDIASLVTKMRVALDTFTIDVEGELTEEHPKYYEKMHVIYEFQGENLPMEKLEKAVKMSEETYCGVEALYKRAIEITSEIRIK